MSAPPPSAAPAPGQIVGRCLLLRPLGAGGMGEVWEAELRGPQGFRKPVALKMLRADGLQGAHREALIREARLGALLQHPNVVGVHGLEEHDGRWIVLMELVRGAPLSDLIREAPLSARALLEVGIQACHGLAHVHGLTVDGRVAGLVHCDVKPQNLLVDAGGLVRLADLGIARTVGAGGPASGTPGYAPPEQMAGRPEPRSDLFALGSTLYACALATRPFGRGEEAVRAVAAVGERLRDPDFLGPLDRVLPGLAEVIGRCLRPDPADRFPSADALRQALEALRPRAPAGEPLTERLGAVRPELRPATTSSPLADLPTQLLRIGNLRPDRDRFFGREDPIRTVRDWLLGDERLVTLLGPGGTGKTRLALRVAAALQPAWPGGAWFFDLSEAVTADGILHTVSTAFGLQLERGDPVGQLGAAFAARGPALLVLDNLEQCVGPARDLLRRWREASPETRFLGTSRVPLSLQGERRLHPGPLPVEEAAALFRDRAPAAVPAADEAELRALVADLEGMPLAIELAAARAGVFTVHQLRARLGDGLRLLAGGGEDRPSRHRSVEASLQWSWELLSEVGREGLAQLSVFEGGFTLEAAEAVLALPGDRWAIDALQELSDASLLQHDPASGRFSMLVPVRAFAAARLSQAARVAAETRHLAWFGQLGERVLADGWASAHGPDLENLLVATRRALELGAPEAVPCACGALKLHDHLGRPPEATLRLSEQALSLPLAPKARLRLLVGLASGCWRASRFDDALRWLGLALPLAETLHERHQEIDVLRLHGLVQADVGAYPEARRWLDRASAVPCDWPGVVGALASAQAQLRLRLGDLEGAATQAAQAATLLRGLDPLGEAGARLALAQAQHHLGQTDPSRAELGRALALYRRVGNTYGEATALGNLAILEADAGDLDRACVLWEEALALHRRSGHRRGAGIVLGNLGEADRQRDRLPSARQRLEEALALHRAVNNRADEAIALAALGSLHAAAGRPTEAMACLDAAVAAQRALELPLPLGETLCRLAALRLAAEDLAGAEAASAEAAMIGLRHGSPTLRAEGLAGRAAAALARGDRAAARASWQEARALSPLPADLRAALDAFGARLEA